MIALAAAAMLLAAQSPPTARADPAVADDVAGAAETIQERLPLSMSNGATVIAVTAMGVELIMELTVPVDLSTAQLPGVEAAARRAACADERARQIVARGGIYTYRMRDSGGEVFAVSVTRC